MRIVRDPAKLLTADDLLYAGSRLEHCELWDGALVIREPSGGWHGPIGATIVSHLLPFVRSAGLGWVCDSTTGYVVRRDPDRVLAPDVSFVSYERLPSFPVAGFVPAVPDFVVEVKSPNDSWHAVAEKCGIWRAHGVTVAWAVHPELRTVVEFRAVEYPREVGLDGMARAAPALAAFEMPVAEMFGGLFPPPA